MNFTLNAIHPKDLTPVLEKLGVFGHAETFLSDNLRECPKFLNQLDFNVGRHATEASK